MFIQQKRWNEIQILNFKDQDVYQKKWFLEKIMWWNHVNSKLKKTDQMMSVKKRSNKKHFISKIE